jgi:hypothetical protein
MSNPNDETIGPDAARAAGAKTGPRLTAVLDKVVEKKATQADHAAANPWRSLKIQIGHFLGGAVLIGFGVFCLKEKVFWAVWFGLMLAGLLVIAPNTVGNGIRAALALMGDAFAKFLAAKKSGGSSDGTTP